MKNIQWFFYNATLNAGDHLPVNANILSPQLNEEGEVNTIEELLIKKYKGKEPETYSWVFVIGGDFTEASLVIENKILLDGKNEFFVPYIGSNFTKFNLKDLTDDAKALNIFGSAVNQKFFTSDILSSIVLDTRIRLVNTAPVSNFYLGIVKIN